MVTLANIGNMEHWSKLKIGIIAEEQNDVDVMYEFTCKIINENMFSFKKFIAHGCGKLRRKCKSWAENLLDRGCSHLIILHDLDDNNEDVLNVKLNEMVYELNYKGYIILIPIFEIESWLLTDSTAIKKTFSLPKLPKLPVNPEIIRDPKEKLEQIVWKACKKHYINTIHNKKIATQININKVISLCKSFRKYPIFLKSILN